MNNMSTLMSSANQGWETPPSLLIYVNKLAGGQIMLDPCTTADNPTNAYRYFTPENDGLSQSWIADGLVYVNSPYGRELLRWTEKAACEAAKGRTILQLLPARPDTRAFQDWIFPRADAICFLRGRLKFKGAKDPAPFPSTLVYYGEDDREFEAIFEELGTVIKL